MSVLVSMPPEIHSRSRNLFPAGIYSQQRPKILASIFRTKVQFSLYILYVYFLCYSQLERLKYYHSNGSLIKSYKPIDHEK